VSPQLASHRLHPRWTVRRWSEVMRER